MSQPTFPSDPNTLTREGAINQILSSIAMEELGLSHIINAEGEKLQYILGTLSGATAPGASIEQVLQANDSVQKLLQTVSTNQMLLKTKMADALSTSVSPSPGVTGICECEPGPTGPAGAIGQDGTTGATGATGPRGLGAPTEFASFWDIQEIRYTNDGTLITLPESGMASGVTIDPSLTLITLQDINQNIIYEINFGVNVISIVGNPVLTLYLNGIPVNRAIIDNTGLISETTLIPRPGVATLSLGITGGTVVLGQSNTQGAIVSTAFLTVTSLN